MNLIFFESGKSFLTQSFYKKPFSFKGSKELVVSPLIKRMDNMFIELVSHTNSGNAKSGVLRPRFSYLKL